MHLKFPVFSCNKICAPTNHVLYRIHASCLWCSTRKALTNPKYKYDKSIGLFLPPYYDCLTAILHNGTGYIIYYDEGAFLGRQKHMILFVLFDIAQRCKYANIAKKLYTVCEFLCT